MSPDLQRIDRTWMRQAVVGASAGEFKVWYLGQQYGAPPNSMAYGQIGKKVELAVQLSAWVEPEGRALKGLEVVLSTRAARSS